MTTDRDDFSGSADVYDVIYRDKDYAGEVRWIVDGLKELGVSGGRWLDVGCGTGRHLAEVPGGFERFGIDRSPTMLERARRRIPDATLAQAPATAIPLDGSFDVVSAIFAVVSYLAGPGELDTFLAECGRLLRPGGLLYFDVWHGGAVLSEGPSPRWQQYATDDGEVLRLSRPVHLLDQHVVEVHYDYLALRGDTVTLRQHECHRVRYLFPRELSEACARHGLDVVRACPSFVEPRELRLSDWSLSIFARRLSE